jgi:hypothetical protein
MVLLITILVLGLLASLSPSTIVVFVLLLATTRARPNAAAFLVGWTVSLIIVFAASYTLGGTRTLRQGGGSLVVDIVELGLGAGLCALGARQWRRRGRPVTRSSITKNFEGRLQGLKPLEATVLGVLEQPWTLTAAAAVIVVRHHSAIVIAVLAFALFTVTSTATIALTYLYFARRPGEAEAHLASLRARLTQAGPALFAGVSFVVGAYLIVDAVAGIISR